MPTSTKAWSWPARRPRAIGDWSPTSSPGQDTTLTAASVRDFLRQRLPAYMVPSAFVLLPTMPLMPNGKLDRAALPAPSAEEEREYVAPRSEAERTLAAVWAEVLGVERVGVTDNFFELGGDSIQGLQMVSRARQAGLHLTPRQMYQHQTIAELAATAGTVLAAGDEADSEIEPIPLTPLQHWFFEQDLGELHGWSAVLSFDAEELPSLAEVQRLCEAFALRHDALRLRFHRTASGWEQKLAPAVVQSRVASSRRGPTPKRNCNAA